MASSSAGVRSWRTAFLTLRDETLAAPPPPALLPLLRDTVLSHSDALIAAASQLPPSEVTSDVMLLVELASAVSDCEDGADACLYICHLIHDVCFKVRLEINTSSWTTMLNFLEKIVERSLGHANNKSLCSGSVAKMKVIADIIEILRLTMKDYGRNGLDAESTQLVRVLLCIITCLHAELLTLYHSNVTHGCATGNGTRGPKFNSLYEMQATAFSMMEDTLSRIGSSISVNLWQSVVEVLRKVMDFLASKNFTVENNVMSRFYTALLQCLHLVLTNPRGSISGHVTGFVATLQMFFTYGLSSRSSSLAANTGSKEMGFGSQNLNFSLMEPRKSERGAYRPPHLRRREGANMHPPDVKSSSDSETSKYCLSSSDSDHSDNDGSAKDGDRYRSSKTRLAAIICIQSLCLADPKSLSSLWTLLLPENDVLQPRKYQSTLMTCLLFDPVLKVRITAASALAAMLDGHSLVFLQVAEYRESAKCGSFTTLSSSLGQILMQLHKGILYLIQHETQTGLLASSFKVLMLLISATPYTRMPGELLPSTIASVKSRIMDDLAFELQHIGLLVTAIGCLGAAFSRSPPSLHVLKMLEEDISRGYVQTQRGSSIIFLLIQFSQGKHPNIGFESLQVLRAVSHNYPNILSTLWEHISATVYGLLHIPSSDNSSHDIIAGSWKGNTDRTSESTTERHTMAAMKVLDACLRAASGFKGTDDLLECRLRDIQLISDPPRRLKILSAPSYELGGPEVSKVYNADCPSGSKQWLEVIEKHLALALKHSAPMVRAASITCFAGMTSSVFFSLPKEKQEFIVSSTISAAVNDEFTCVRSAACRAIGVISCFSQIFCSTGVLNEFIRAAEFNTHDPIASVCITASWALANICDSLRHRATELHMEMSAGEVTYSESISLLVETALRLTKDGDKIKSNAVRALGNLSRFIRFTPHSVISNEPGDSMCSFNSAQSIEFSPSNVSESTLCGDSHWLERMVQAFVSCVTTGNVKVQWNVCHAMSNLFMNDTLKLQDMSWGPVVYTILLLLLRDSTNFKIRIHAAVALAVPTSRPDYGKSYPDVVQGLENVLESVVSDEASASASSSYKYKDNLEKQLTLTTLHVLAFASSEDDQALKDFLIKKAPFLEEWLRLLRSSFMESDDQPSTSGAASSENQENGSFSHAPKKAMLSRALKSLVDVYESSNQQGIARRFEILYNSLSSSSAIIVSQPSVH